MLSRGETVGVFQMANEGFTKYLKDLKPTKVEDLMAMVALYRPGPMDVIPEYIKRKNNPALVKYLDPRMESYLQASYGLIVYQDDLLFSAIELAGYDWLEADKFRKAVGKKIPAEMAAQKEKLMKGIVENGQTEAFAEHLWKLFEPFQAYGFNKAHAASYGMIAYKTAYLKANFPAEYMTACMTAEAGDIETCSEYIEEAKRMGFTILPPDINQSFSDFTVVVENGEPTSNIRFGLNNIKNFGTEIGKAIIAERKERGKFRSIEDFLERVQHKNLNKKSLEALIMCGALDAFGERGNLLGNIDALLSFHKDSGTHSGPQDSLFGSLGDAAPQSVLTLLPTDSVSLGTKLAWEKELLGLYISGHPLDQFPEQLARVNTTIAKLIKDPSAKGKLLVAHIDTIKVIMTKASTKMAFLTLRDKTGVAEGVVFPDSFKEIGVSLVEGRVMVFQCGTSKRDDRVSITIDKAKALS